jgi:hypothetical protein
MTINGRTFNTKGRDIKSYIEDWITEEIKVIFKDGTYLETHGDVCIEGTLKYLASDA